MLTGLTAESIYRGKDKAASNACGFGVVCFVF